jgi:hypothetical protein
MNGIGTIGSIYNKLDLSFSFSLIPTVAGPCKCWLSTDNLKPATHTPPDAGVSQPGTSDKQADLKSPA